jgi:hypothetical protein
MIYVNPQGKTELAHTPEYVPTVPNKREATQALAAILASLTDDQCANMEQEIDMVRRFLWSR